jgi:hypothetical protein
MSRSQSPGSPGTQPGTAEATQEDASAGVAAVLPAPPAHAPDVDGMESPFAAWSLGAGVAASPDEPRPVDALASPPEASTWEPLAEPQLDLAGVDAGIRPAQVHFFGPIGRRRSPLLVVATAVATLGVSALRWHLRVNEEMGNFDPRMSVRPRRSLLAVVIPYVAAWAVAITAAARIAAAHIAPQTSLPLSDHTAYWLLATPLLIPYAVLLTPFSLVAVVRTAERLRVLEDRVDVFGVEQLRPVAAVCWLLAPVVGGLTLMATLQRRLNAVFARVRPR